jgi:hypothetical protein
MDNVTHNVVKTRLRFEVKELKNILLLSLGKRSLLTFFVVFLSYLSIKEQTAQTFIFGNIYFLLKKDGKREFDG